MALSQEQLQWIKYMFGQLFRYGFYVLCGYGMYLNYKFYKAFVAPGYNLRRKYGGWAVVTGCTDGIGKAFCIELAKDKIPLLLISRTESKLKDLAKELETKYDVETKYLAVDFGNASEATWEKVKSTIEGLEVGMLFNNVGVSYPHAQYLHELDDEIIASLIAVNVTCTTKMTKFVLPGMVERKRGAIINIGSGAATVLPSDPLYSVYAGTKGYVDQFSKSLSVEYSKYNIDVQVQAPLFVASKMSKIRRASLTVPSPRQYAVAGLAKVGTDVRVSPFWSHTVIWAIIHRMPVFLMDKVRLSMTTSIRKRALAKKNKKA